MIDKIFKAYDVRATYPNPLNEEMAWRVGHAGQMGEHPPKDPWPAYRKHVLQFLKLSRPLRVAIDATNGMAGKMVPAVFGDVPDLEIIPVLFEITGSFTHDPNPLVTENLAIVQEKIADTKPALGVAFDGDADRCLFLTQWGAPIGCDLVTALLAADFLKQPQNKGSTVVYDLRSSHVVA